MDNFFQAFGKVSAIRLPRIVFRTMQSSAFPRIVSGLVFSVVASSLLLTGCSNSGSYGGVFRGLAPGSKAPAVDTKTLADANGDLSQVTTYREPDARMYQYSVAQALAMHKPILLVFATPGHCTECDEQLQVAKALLDKYGSQVIFIHMDQYMNPEAYKAFKVMGDPWTFAIDRHGIVRETEAGKMLYGEMEDAVKKILPKSGNSGVS